MNIVENRAQIVAGYLTDQCLEINTHLLTLDKDIAADNSKRSGRNLASFMRRLSPSLGERMESVVARKEKELLKTAALRRRVLLSGDTLIAEDFLERRVTELTEAGQVVSRFREDGNSSVTAETVLAYVIEANKAKKVLSLINPENPLVQPLERKPSEEFAPINDTTYDHIPWLNF